MNTYREASAIVGFKFGYEAGVVGFRFGYEAGAAAERARLAGEGE